MLNTTLASLRCPGRARKPCRSELALHVERAQGDGAVFDVLAGHLECGACRARYPILGGVAVVVADVRAYLLEHAKGIRKLVPVPELPREHARELKAAFKALDSEPEAHIEEDLEAERVVSLYLMNHYLPARATELAWWKPSDPSGRPGSPVIASLAREYWEHGPLSRVKSLIEGEPGPQARRVLELGCGVGGLSLRIQDSYSHYLGVDSSFASIALARHVALGAPYRAELRIPEDLLAGPVSRRISLPRGIKPLKHDGRADFVVGDIDRVPVAEKSWDLSIAMSAIDMLEDPSQLPAMQRKLLAPRGRAIQCCPYIWHERIARKLRARLPKQIKDSASAAEWLYEREGFEILKSEDHVPWLFFKHLRQMELYSVHLFVAQMGTNGASGTAARSGSFG